MRTQPSRKVAAVAPGSPAYDRGATGDRSHTSPTPSSSGSAMRTSPAGGRPTDPGRSWSRIIVVSAGPDSVEE